MELENPLKKQKKPSKANSESFQGTRMLTDSEIASLRQEFQEAEKRAEAYFEERFGHLRKQQKPQK